ncbi:MAG: PDDEXK family nuclease [Acidimicrobiales bacterium]
MAPSTARVHSKDPILHLASARAVAFEQGTLIDFSSTARAQYLHIPVAFHVEVINRLRRLGDEEYGRKALESILDLARFSLTEDRRYDELHARSGDSTLAPLGARRTILDNGEEVITIFDFYFVDPTLDQIGRGSSGADVLMSSSELVAVLRAAWCEPDATVGRRVEGLGPVINRSTNWGGEPDPDQDSKIQSLVNRDPVAAARLAEEMGFWSRASDCWLLAGDVAGALDVIPLDNPATSGGNSWTALTRVILALVLRSPLNAADLLLLHDNRLTTWGRKHLDEVVECLQSHIDTLSGTSEDVGHRLLCFKDVQWRHTWMSLYWISRGMVEDGEGELGERLWPWLSKSKLGAAYCEDLTRQIENEVRVNVGQHRVGEGWVSETEVFNLINEHFGQITKVVQHGRPAGLGRQHLDVWIPEWKIGIEYQGLQHDQPVEFFGGQDAWLRALERDAKKKSLCSEQGITLIEVRPGFNLEDLILDIERNRPR